MSSLGSTNQNIIKSIWVAVISIFLNIEYRALNLDEIVKSLILTTKGTKNTKSMKMYNNFSFVSFVVIYKYGFLATFFGAISVFLIMASEKL
jgi:hypothetical protein